MFTVKAGAFALSLFLLYGCGKSDDGAAASTTAAEAPIAVQTVIVAHRTFVNESELPGRIVPVREAEIRARAAGLVQKRHFIEGETVRKGDVLFTIERAPFEAALAQARGVLAREAAEVKKAQSVVRRNEQLIRSNAVSRQAHDDGLAALQVAQGNHASAQARVKAAQLDLNHATVRAPIAGRIGRSLVSEGSLVGQGESTPMALIQQMDPIYADFTQTARAAQGGTEVSSTGSAQGPGLNAQAQRQTLRVSVDGVPYKTPGRLLFAGTSVNPETGQVTLRGEFPNAEGILLPGMYVRVKTEQRVDREAIFVPQRAVLFDKDGHSRVLIVNSEGKAQERRVDTGVMQGAQWQITQGLVQGDQVIVQGADKIVPGARVKVEIRSADEA